MKILPYEHPGVLIPRLINELVTWETLLDVGGGCGSSYGAGEVHTLDIFPPETVPKNFMLGNALDAVEIYGEKSFDVVVCREMIEHLIKVNGARLIPILESVARKLVLFTCPNGFDDQSPEDHPNEPWANNPYQKHLCGWEPYEFNMYGYTVQMNGGVPERNGAAGQIIAWKVIQS